jgi:AraC family transcriptional regulator
METTELDQASPVVLKRKAEWEGIRLEHFRLRGGDLPEHSHREHMALVSLSDVNRSEFQTSTGMRLDGTLTKGSVCVLPSGTTHKARLNGESEHLALFLDPLLMQRVAANANLPADFEVVERCTQKDDVISNVGMALLGELESEGLSGRLYAESLANVLAVHLMRHYTTGATAPQPFRGGLSGQRLRQVKDFIAANYAEELRLEELAHEAGMSSFHFAREFKKSTGTSPHQYLIKFRVERAKSLRAESEMPLTEVGLRSGFSHQSHFTRLFHRLTGTTPQSYRQMLSPVRT